MGFKVLEMTLLLHISKLFSNILTSDHNRGDCDFLHPPQGQNLPLYILNCISGSVRPPRGRPVDYIRHVPLEEMMFIRVVQNRI